MKAPHPIRTAKLSIVGPDQYYSWGQCGNLGCCRALYLLFGFLNKIVVSVGVEPGSNTFVVRSYHDESTASHPNCEVKHRWARSVLQLGTMWESRVLYGPLLFYFLFRKKKKTAVLSTATTFVVRSYHDESTASHPNCEVKHRWARSVLQLGTMWESRVLNGP